MPNTEKLTEVTRVTTALTPVRKGDNTRAFWEYIPPESWNIPAVNTMRICCDMVKTMPTSRARATLRPVVAIPVPTIEKMPAPMMPPIAMKVRSNRLIFF